MRLTQSELDRYKRQMMMEGWGEDVQKSLKGATVFIAGAGGLGSPVSIYLAVAGVGTLRICDFDAPDMSNLNRQILHDHTRVGLNKALSAQQTLARINPDVAVIPITTRIEADNVDELVGDARVIVDCMDNYPTRFVLNDSAIRKKIPLIHGSVWGLEGRMTFIRVPATACLRCIVEEGPPKEVFPVIGATPGVIGTLQVVEAVKYLTGIGKNLEGKMLAWDGALMSFRTFKTRRDPACPSCAGR